MEDFRIKRNIQDSIFNGVCSGISKRTGINLILLRTLWTLSCLFYGIGIALYIFMSFMPEDSEY